MNRAGGHQTRDGLTIIYNVVTYIIRLSATPIPPPGSMISVGEGGGEGVEVGSFLKMQYHLFHDVKLPKIGIPPPPRQTTLKRAPSSYGKCLDPRMLMWDGCMD